MPSTTPSKPAKSKPKVKPLIVQKFGGTSVADAEKIKRVARIIVDTYEQGSDVITVVSAMGHDTDHLVDLARQITDNPSGREYDALLSTGEMVTTALMALTIESMGYKAVGLNGQQAGIITEDLPNRARILEIDTTKIKHYLDNGYIVIVTGFQGISSKGDITTLGRGGSDTSAVALAAAFEAERCDIYTDVRGIFSTDPRVVPEAVKLDQVSYIEMMELARMGAQVLHPRAVELARQADVCLSKRSTFDLEDPGTMVVGTKTLEKEQSVTGIACDLSQARVALLDVPDKPGVAAEIFGTLAEQNISVDMIIQSLAHDAKTNDIAFTLHADDLKDALRVLGEVKQKIGAREIKTDEAIAKVSIVGAGMIDKPGIAANLFKSLAEASINIKMISTSEIKVSCLVDKDKGHDAVRAIHKTFFPNAKTPEEVLVNVKLGY